MSVTSFPARIVGVIRSPRATFAEAVRRPKWLDVLLLTTVVSFACSAVLFSTEVGQLALVDQWERTAIAFGQEVDDAEYARLLELSSLGIPYAGLTAVLSGPGLAVAVAAALVLLLRGVFGVAATFVQTLAVTSHAGVILAVRNVVATPLNYAFETVASPTTLIRLAGPLDEGAPLARFLGAIDVFTIWWIVVLAIGASVIARRSIRPLALAFAGAYVALALLLVGVMALTGGTA